MPVQRTVSPIDGRLVAERELADAAAVARALGPGGRPRRPRGPPAGRGGRAPFPAGAPPPPPRGAAPPPPGGSPPSAPAAPRSRARPRSRSAARSPTAGVSLGAWRSAPAT